MSRTHRPLPLIRPDLTYDEVAKDLRAVIDSGLLTGGPAVARFEQALAEMTGRKHAIATSSATTGLHLALAAAGIGPGDEVLVSDFTFPATGNVIVQTGATPVLVDCLPGRFDIDPTDAERRITSRTRALMVVDPFGQPAEYDRLTALAKAHGLLVFEDAACAIGARRSGRMCGAWGTASVFSFHPRKVITAGEGGMVLTDDPELAERLALLRTQGGRPAAVGMEFVAHGYNYRLSELPAVLGLAQARRLNEILAERRRIAGLYREALSPIPGLTVPLSGPPEDCTFQSFVVLLDVPDRRDRAIASLKGEGIETTLGTYAMHAQPAFAHLGHEPGDLAHSWHAQQASLTLPLSKGMTAEDVDFVATALARVLA